MAFYSRFIGDGSPPPTPITFSHEAIVDELHQEYPNGQEGFGLRAMIRLTVWTVLRMKERGLI